MYVVNTGSSPFYIIINDSRHVNIKRILYYISCISMMPVARRWIGATYIHIFGIDHFVRVDPHTTPSSGGVWRRNLLFFHRASCEHWFGSYVNGRIVLYPVLISCQKKVIVPCLAVVDQCFYAM